MAETTRYLIVQLEGEDFAIPITSLLEIAASHQVQKDPNLSEIFEGKIDYRGKMIPAVNLKKVLGMSGKPGNALIVIKGAKGVLGLLVDAAKELLEFTGRPLPLPAGIINSGRLLYAGVLKSRDELVLLLNEDGLLP
ncbi:MAG: chemotaxis protein CheW [Nitrospiraceae bacterium]|nr:chemotaxis protein CheW [Nitrospiraceae bacterium]